MASITWADVLTMAPELSTVSAGGQTSILAYVNGALNVDEFVDGEDGAQLKLARIYLAAHLGTLALPDVSGASSSIVTSESAGPLSRSYAQLSTSEAQSLTSYGSFFSELIRRTPARAPIVL